MKTPKKPAPLYPPEEQEEHRSRFWRMARAMIRTGDFKTDTEHRLVDIEHRLSEVERRLREAGL